MAPGLTIEGLVVRAGGRTILDVPRLAVAPGDAVAIRGPSGAGKSTLLRALAGLLPVAEGRIIWDGVDLGPMGPEPRAAFRRRTLGLVFQDARLFDELDAAGNVTVAAGFAPSAERAALRARGLAWLDRLGLGGAGGREVSGLSGGERQRVALARALAAEPPVILADEPTASLDRAAGQGVAQALAELAGSRTVIVVTHDEAVMVRMGRVLSMADGRIVADDGAAHG